MPHAATSLNTLQEFLHRVLPADGVFVAVRNPAGTKDFKQKALKTHDEVANHLLSGGPQGGKANCYMALASFEQGWHEAPNGKMVLRTRDNAASLRSLWMDIDFKGDYDSPKACLSAVAGFCRAVKLPAPTLVVGSGGGVHVYWTLTRALAGAQWDELATALKDAALRHGLKFDAMCTADRARILRAPFTRNHKSTPAKSVSILVNRPHDIDPEAMRAALGAWTMPDLGGTLPAALRGAADAAADLGGGVGVGQEFPPTFMRHVVERCEVMKVQLFTGGRDSAEPLWNNTLLLSQFCEDGPEYIHRLSEKHPGYSQKETEYKFQQKKGAAKGPPTCQVFEAEMPEACRRCALRGRIKTPAQAGEEDYRMPGALPKNWRYTPEGGMEMATYTLEAGKWKVDWQAALSIAIYDLHLGADSGKVHELSFAVQWANGKRDTIVFAAEKLGSGTQFKSELAKRGLGLHSVESDKFLRLVMDWMKELKNTAMTNTLIDSFGWHENRFITGDTIFTASGPERHSIHKKIASEANHFIASGELDKWKEVAQVVRQKPVLEAVLATAFAAPLIHFTAVRGTIFSIIGESGAGKSTALRTALAVWGNPTLGMSSTTDTHNRHTAKMGLLRNLPVYYDEVRGKRALMDFAQLSFEIGQGRSKGRLNANAEVAAVTEWSTMMVVASNDSLSDYLAETHGRTAAAVLRVFELDAGDDPSFKTTLDDPNLIEEHYGVAGAAYAEYLAGNITTVKKLLSVQTAALEKDWSSKTNERFWTATCATILVGARIAKALKLVDFDLATLKHTLYLGLENSRKNLNRKVLDNDPIDTVVAFLQENMDYRLVTNKMTFTAGRGQKASAVVEIYETPTDKRAVRYQIGTEDQRLRVVRASFRRFLDRQGEVNPVSFMRDLENKNGVVLRKCQVGVGTSYVTPPQHVLEFRLDNPQLGKLLAAYTHRVGNNDIT